MSAQTSLHETGFHVEDVHEAIEHSRAKAEHDSKHGVPDRFGDAAGLRRRPSTVDRSAALNPPGPSLTTIINQKMAAAQHPAVVTFAFLAAVISRIRRCLTDSSRSF